MFQLTNKEINVTVFASYFKLEISQTFDINGVGIDGYIFIQVIMMFYKITKITVFYVN